MAIKKNALTANRQRIDPHLTIISGIDVLFSGGWCRSANFRYSQIGAQNRIAMNNALTDQLKRVIESRLGGVASFARSMRVAPAGRQPTEWDGIVHLFDLQNNPQAKRAYAWSSPINGGKKPRYFAVLHSNRVKGPQEAVKAVVAAIRSSK